jgi:prepilin peptidase CpaA
VTDLGTVRWEVWVVVLAGVAAVVEDLARRTISNWTSLGALLAGFVGQVAVHGWSGFGKATLGAVAGFAVFLIFYWLGGMGGGDVKLMAGFGAVLGTGRLLEAALWTAITGGLLAGIVLGAGFLRRKLASPRRALPEAIPYAPAIVLGAWLALIAGK